MERFSRFLIPYGIIFLLIACTLWVYWPVKDHEFLYYDDVGYIVKNFYIQPGVTWENILWAFSSGYAANWHPLTWISHMLDFQLFQLDPAGHHLHNVFLHILSSLALFFVLRKMTGAAWPSAFVAFIFALHPLHVESVAWASERKDMLSGLLWMATMGAYVVYASTPTLRRYLLVLLLFTLGLLAKPMLVTLPFVLLLLDYWPLKRLSFSSVQEVQSHSFSYLLIEKVPLILWSVGSSIITYIVQQQAGAMSTVELLPLSARLSNAIVSYSAYIGKTFWPADLAVFYPHPGNGLSFVAIAGSAMVLMVLTGACLAAARRFPYLVVGWFWYLGTLVPVSGLVQVGAQAMADRYLYLPMIGLTVMLAWFVVDVTKRWGFRKQVLVSAVVVLVAALTMVSRTQVGYWKNDRTLFEHALSITENNWLAHYSLGTMLTQQHNFAEAKRHYEETIRLNPRLGVAYYDLGNLFMRLEEPEKAIPYFQAAIEKGAELEKAHVDLGVALTTVGREEGALKHFTEAYRMNPLYGEPHQNVALLLVKAGKFDVALQYLRVALDALPRDSVIQADIARVLELKKK